MANPGNFITDQMEIYNLIKSFQSQKLKLWSWQTEVNEKGLRPVHYSLVRKVDLESVYFRSTNTGGYRFNKEHEVFIFMAENGLAIKCPIRGMGGQEFIIGLPKRISKLGKDFLSNVELVEREDEAAHLGERHDPRVQAKKGQVVGLRRVSGGGGKRGHGAISPTRYF